MRDMTIFEGDPDAIVLETIDAYAKGKATRDDVDAAMVLALERPRGDWRPQIEHRYAALVLWTSQPAELNAMLERVLSWGITAKGPRGVQ